MAYSVNWITKVITIPTADLVLVVGNEYNLPMQEFLDEIRRLEWDPSDGLWAPAILEHTNSKPNFAGASYAGFDSIINGYTITISGTATRVNITGSNNNLIDVLNVTGVSLVPTNSAGLQDLSVLLAAAYQGQVVVNTVTGQDGTASPIGTFKLPSKNEIDAKQIAIDNGINTFTMANDITLYINHSGSPLFKGISPYVVLTIDPIADLTGAAMQNLTIQGELDGLNVLRNCSIMVVTKVSGFIEKCAFLSTVHFNNDMLVMECYSNVEGGGYPVFTRTVVGKTIEVRDWHGSIGIGGITDVSHTIGGAGGRCVIEATCTGGTIHVRGDWFEIVDNSGAGCTVLDERATGGAGGTWTTEEKTKSLIYSKKASDNAEQANKKLR